MMQIVWYINTYGNELYAFQVRDNLLSVIGAPTASNMNHAIVTPSFTPLTA